jgi:hypothetical protein
MCLLISGFDLTKRRSFSSPTERKDHRSLYFKQHSRSLRNVDGSCFSWSLEMESTCLPSVPVIGLTWDMQRDTRPATKPTGVFGESFISRTEDLSHTGTRHDKWRPFTGSEYTACGGDEGSL